MTINNISNLSAAINDSQNSLDLERDFTSMYSKDVALKLGYLLGVWEDKLTLIAYDKEVNKTITSLKNNSTAVVIRALCNIRSNLMLQFKYVSHRIRIGSDCYAPIDKLEWFEDDFKTLNREDVIVNDGSGDIIRFIENANREIEKRLDSLKSVFPDWVNFHYIRNSFCMSGDIKTEMKKFQENQNCYPFKRYFNWKKPLELGNILENDLKILEIIYESNNSYFNLRNKVVDASIRLKDNIKDFLTQGNKICVFIDGENCDPYKFVSMLNSLEDYEINKVDNIIVFYDNKHSNCSWTMLSEASKGIEVETIAVERINDKKSLVDHKLSIRVATEVYKNGVDSVVIVSSDSDFWTIADDIEVNCLFAIEYEKSGNDFKERLKENNVFYCYLDRFKEPSDNAFFKTVFRKELEDEISHNFALCNSTEFLRRVIKRTRKQVTSAEISSLYDNYIRKLKLDIDSNGNFKIVIPE